MLLYRKSRLWGCYYSRHVTNRDVFLLATIRYVSNNRNYLYAALKTKEFPSTVETEPSLYRIKSPSSRFHKILGRGDPRASHVKLTGLPSLTTISVEVLASIMDGGTGNQS